MPALNDISGTCVPHIAESVSVPLAESVSSSSVVPDARTSKSPLTRPA